MNSEKIKELLKQSSDYWERRSLSTALNAIENEEDYLKRLKSIYDKANQDIQDKLAVVYTRYAKNNNISLTEAYSKLPKDIENKYKADVEEYVRLATEHQGDPKWKQYLLNQSLMHKHSVLNQLQTEYRKAVYDIDMEQTGGKFLEKIYTNTDYYNQYLNGNDEQFAKVDKDRIQRLIAEDWSGGGDFSEKIWGNKEKLIKALDETVIKGFATGQSYDSLAKELAKKMDTAYSNAQRLIMTESARMDNQSLLDRYREMGATKLEFVATLDMRTSEICRAMDGTIIDIENAKIGLNVPPLHPYCRSVIAPVMEDDKGSETRVYRDPETGKSKNGKLKTYKDYLEKVLGDKKAAEALASKQNDLRTLVNAVSSITPEPVGKVTADKIDLNPSQELVNKTDQYNKSYLERNNVENIEEFEKNIKQELNNLLEENEFATRTSMEGLEKILEEGRIKSQFETDKSSTVIGKDFRAEVEETLYGYPRNLDPKLRPIYGYLTNTKNGFEFSRYNGAVKYGNVSIILKKKGLSNRTTFTLGDSLDGTRYNYKVPTLYDQPSMQALSASRSLCDRYGTYTGKVGKDLYDVTNNVSYLELQFHGGVSIDNIEKVYIHTYVDAWNGRQYFNIDTKQINKLEKALKKAGIDYEVVK
nr:minor head protein [Caudoviricetes sp.]